MNLITGTPSLWAECLAQAARMGSRDATAGDKPKTGKEIVVALAIGEHRRGHRYALKAAYSAGRFHIETMGEP